MHPTRLSKIWTARPYLPKDARAISRPRNLRDSYRQFRKIPKKAHWVITVPKMNHKNFVLERTSGGCYHRRAEQPEIEDPAFAATVCYHLTRFFSEAILQASFRKPPYKLHFGSHLTRHLSATTLLELLYHVTRRNATAFPDSGDK